MARRGQSHDTGTKSISECTMKAQCTEGHSFTIVHTYEAAHVFPISYSWKIWQGIRFGGWPSAFTITN